MGFENMRSGHARCPTYLVAGLLLMTFLLTCNWWSLSSQNYDLLSQMNDMGSQLDVCSDERAICLSRRNNLDGELREMQKKIQILETSKSEEVEKLTNEKIDLEKTVASTKQDLTFCRAELDSLKKVDSSKQATLESLRVEKDSLANQLGKSKERIAELEESLVQVQKKPDVKDVPPAPMPKYASSTAAQKKVKDESQDVLAFPINDGPVNDGNHENNKDFETALENAANEEVDDNFDNETGKRPPINVQTQ